TAFWSVASPRPREAGVARALAVGPHVPPIRSRPGPGLAGVAKREDSYGRISGPNAGSRASSPGEQAAACDYRKTRALGCARQPIGRRYPHTLRIRPEQELSNDFQIDREVQRQNTGSAGYTGIQGIAMQDAAMTTSMGLIYDRSKEHLGTTDATVIRVRRRLIAAMQAHMKHGITPPGVDDPGAYRVRSG